MLLLVQVKTQRLRWKAGAVPLLLCRPFAATLTANAFDAGIFDRFKSRDDPLAPLLESAQSSMDQSIVDMAHHAA